MGSPLPDERVGSPPLPDERALLRAHEKAEAATERAQGRMKIKLLGAKEALAGGTGRVVIGDARGPGALREALDGRGTVIS